MPFFLLAEPVSFMAGPAITKAATAPPVPGAARGHSTICAALPGEHHEGAAGEPG